MKVHGIEINFKPKFGDERQSRVLSMIGEINANETLLKKKQKEARGAATLRKKIFKQVDELKKAVDFLNGVQ